MARNVLDISFERDVIAEALRNRRFAHRLCLAIGDNDIFRLPQARYIYRHIYQRFQEKQLLSRRAFRDILAKDKDLEEKNKFIFYKEFKTLQSKTVSETEYAYREIKKYCDFLRLKNYVGNLNTDISNGVDFYKAIATFKANMVEIGDLPLDDSLSYHNTWRQRQQSRQQRRALLEDRNQYDDNDFVIPSGIGQLDVKLYGGLEASKAATILAKVNVGKSIWLVNVAYNAIYHDFNVIFFTLEDTKELVSTRLDSRMTGIPFIKLKNYALNDQEAFAADQIVERFYEDRTAKIEIIQGDSTMTMEDMIQITHAKENEMGEKFHLFVVDYLDIAGHKGNFKDERFKQKAVYQLFKDFLKEEKRAGWTATQAKAKVVKSNPTKEDVSEAYDKAKILDVIISLGETEEMAENNQMSGYIAKWREGQRGVKLALTTKKDISLITDFIED